MKMIKSKLLVISLFSLILSCSTIVTKGNDINYDLISKRNIKYGIDSIEINNNQGFEDPNQFLNIGKFDKPVVDVVKTNLIPELYKIGFAKVDGGEYKIRISVNSISRPPDYLKQFFFVEIKPHTDIDCELIKIVKEKDKPEENIIYSKKYKKFVDKNIMKTLFLGNLSHGKVEKSIQDCIKEFTSDINDKLIATNLLQPYQNPFKETITSKENINNQDGIFTGESEKWAVVIGISEYKDRRIPSLNYASKDAKEFYKWLTSTSGGNYNPYHVKLLLDSEATNRNIKDALFSWLKQPIKEDMITIYIAGHGSPESYDSEDNLYILPYDAEYNNIASTGFPMWDVETALKRFVKAGKVVIMVDACHAGGVGKSFDIATRAGRAININPIPSKFQELTNISDGVCVLSASSDSQLSQEDVKWGGGHGVFTYFLIEGLKGLADYNNDSFVTLGELIPFLSEKVRRETNSKQTPKVLGDYDPALRISK